MSALISGNDRGGVRGVCGPCEAVCWSVMPIACSPSLDRGGEGGFALITAALVSAMWKVSYVVVDVAKEHWTDLAELLAEKWHLSYCVLLLLLLLGAMMNAMAKRSVCTADKILRLCPGSDVVLSSQVLV